MNEIEAISHYYPVFWEIVYRNEISKTLLSNSGTKSDIGCGYGVRISRNGGVLMKRWVFYDTVAKHSTENAYYSYFIAKQRGAKKIALYTDQYQAAF
ncbi:MAG TPA: hypothetical protein VL098_05430 [Flavipsychrobacter sp.]|nr:hypothetical protein [Flavipsychrobacter sp.]